MPQLKKMTAEVFFKQQRHQVVPAGKTIVQAGEDLPGIFFVQRGYVRTMSVSRAGEEMTFHVFKPGTFFPMSWVFHPEENRYDYQTLRECELYQAPTEEVREFLLANPEELLRLAERFAGGLEGYATRIRQLVAGDALSKTGAILSYLTKFFGKPHAEGGILLDFPLTHEFISSWTGTTRVSVSQAIGKLKQQGLVRYLDGRILLPDPDKLYRVSMV